MSFLERTVKALSLFLLDDEKEKQVESRQKTQFFSGNQTEKPHN
jgi:hypothetical protein